ncbi:surface antigen-domain-containing protein [Boletus edulis BED1]|uniref:Surface antigen-domain-containing protein n=1 Tax=Boletus edulis BED1 TaxID=1328754 RepID=A0AAD4BM62_BOLED|nr:surface antigen-domain-containing protein [Boletus edulis BED1]
MVELVDAPVSLAAVRVLGADATSRAFLDWLIAPHLLTPNLSTFRDVLDTTTAISRALAASGLFRDQSVRIQPAEDGDPAHVDVVYNVRERGRFFIKTSTELGDGEGSASLEGRLVNLFGHADVLSLNASLGTKTKRAFDASLSFPVTPTLSSRAFLSLIGTERELGAQGGGGREERMALKAGIRKFALGTPTPGNELAAELAWRCIGSLSDDAGISVRQSAGPASKASLLHTYTHDTLNDAVMPTSGSLLRVINELSLASKLDSFVPQPSSGASQTLLGQGNNAFWKTEAHAKKGWSLTQGLTLSLTGRAGLLQLLAGDPSTIHYSDKFQLGGPLSVRAFGPAGMGGHEGLTSVGGDFYYSLGLSILGNIPRRPQWPTKFHAWINAGRLQGIGGSPLFRSIHSAVTQPSISVGLGLVYRFDPIRVEVNLGVPLVAAKGEILKRGPQVGIGLEFL